MSAVLAVAAALFGVGAALAAVRLVIGPTTIDRAIALDVLLTIFVGIIVLLAVLTESDVTLVIAVVVALLGFLGSSSLSKLLPRDRS